jgi:hypothetical protein
MVAEMEVGFIRNRHDALDARGVPTARGGKWAPTQIADILDRAK